MNAISCEELKDRIGKGTMPLLIDVREQEEWDAGHIEGAVHIPLDGLVEKIGLVEPNKKTEIVVHCAKGGRSLKACIALEERGYENVRNLEGGYEAYCLKG